MTTSVEKYDEALQMLNAGFSARYVSKWLKMSRNVVNCIAQGRQVRGGTRIKFMETLLPAYEAPPSRCPGCGELVTILPCVICAAVDARKRSRKQFQ